MSVSKKLGKSAVVYYYCSFSQFFLKQTLVILLHLYKQQQISCSLHIFTKNEFRFSLKFSTNKNEFGKTSKLHRPISDEYSNFALVTWQVFFLIKLRLYIPQFTSVLGVSAARDNHNVQINQINKINSKN